MEERLRFYEEGVAPRKNTAVMAVSGAGAGAGVLSVRCVLHGGVVGVKGVSGVLPCVEYCAGVLGGGMRRHSMQGQELWVEMEPAACVWCSGAQC